MYVLILYGIKSDFALTLNFLKAFLDWFSAPSSIAFDPIMLVYHCSYLKLNSVQLMNWLQYISMHLVLVRIV